MRPLTAPRLAAFLVASTWRETVALREGSPPQHHLQPAPVGNVETALQRAVRLEHDAHTILRAPLHKLHLGVDGHPTRRFHNWRAELAAARAGKLPLAPWWMWPSIYPDPSGVTSSNSNVSSTTLGGANMILHDPMTLVPVWMLGGIVLVIIVIDYIFVWLTA